MNELIGLIDNGNWSVAIKQLQTINPSGREYGDFLNSIEDANILRDLALLGFYAREYIGDR